MYPAPIWMSFGGEAPNNDQQLCLAPKTLPLGGLHVLHRVTLFIGFTLQEFWSFATNVLATTKKSSLLGIH